MPGSMLLRVGTGAVLCGRRALCTAFRSRKFEAQEPADKQTVDDLIDGYDVSVSGEVTGDLPTGHMQKRIQIGYSMHHSRNSVPGQETGRKAAMGVTGDYESFYHMRLPRVAGFEAPRKVASDFLKFNTVVYPPRMDDGDDASRLPAETGVEIRKIAIDPKALLLFGIAVQGMPVQPALEKLHVLSQRPKGQEVWRKFGYLAPLCLAQAIEAGVRQMVYEETVEYEANLWIESVKVAQDGTYAVIRKSARWNLINYRRPFSVLRVRLREGRPPAYYHPNELPAFAKNWRPNWEIMQREKEKLRSQRIYKEL